MNFLTPLFLVGALAVALPIVFHLIRRTTREKTPFSSLMFLMPSPPRVTRRSRLENIFLLILRCLVLCLLALGFARPFLQKALPSGPSFGGGKKVVVLVDSSASMRRSGLWADAQAKADEVLKKIGVEDQAALFTFDRQINRLVNFEQWSNMGVGERAALSAQRLDNVQPGWSSTHLGNALVSAAEALEEARDSKQQTAKQIVLISDLQEGSRLDALQAFEWPKGVELVVEPVKARRPTNAGLQLATDHTDLAQTTADAGTRVRVINAGDSKREQFKLGWARAGEKSFVGTTVDAYVPPGQSRVFTAPKVPDGLAGEQLVLTGDDEDFDNTIFIVPPKAEQIKVLYLGSETEKDSTQPLYYLKLAFQQTRKQVVQVVARSSRSSLLPTDAEGASLLIATDTLADDAANSVRQFLIDGKTVLFVLKSAASAPTLARLLNLGNVTAEEGAPANYAMLGQIEFEHPLFAPFDDPRFSDFTKIHFWKFRRLETDRIPGARILARFDKGEPALVQVPVGKGTLLLLTSGWQPADSQLALSSKFVPLLYSILEQSGGIKAQTLQYLVGDPVVITESRAPDMDKSLIIRKPDGSQVELPKGEKFSQTDLPGIYTVALLQPPLRFAVNLDPAECKTAPLPLEELERLGVPIKQTRIENPKLAEQKRQHLMATELESRQKLWRWLVVAALAVLLVETWLAGWLTRRATVPAEATA